MRSVSEVSLDPLLAGPNYMHCGSGQIRPHKIYEDLDRPGKSSWRVSPVSMLESLTSSQQS